MTQTWRSPVALFRLLIILTLLAGAACSRTPTPRPDQPGETAGEQVIITFAADEYNRRLYEPLMKTFNEQNPGIQVQFVNMRENEPEVEGEWSADKWYRSMASAADTTLIGGSNDVDMSRYFRNLQPLIESDPSFQADDFWGGVLAGCEDSYGNRVGVPLSVYLSGVFYDPAAFDAAGLPYPGPGWTLENFRTATLTLSNKKDGKIQYGFMDQFYLYGSVLLPAIDSHLDAHGGEIEPAAFLQDIGWYIDLAKADALFPIVDMTDEENSNIWMIREEMFQEGRPPLMWVDSLISSIPGGNVMWDQNNPIASMSISKYGFAPYPAFPTNSNTSPAGAECAAISAGSTHPREAWTWINFLSRQWLVTDASMVWEMSRIPARKSVADTNNYWDIIPESSRDSVRYALDHTGFPVMDYIQMEEINYSLSRHIQGKANFADALADKISQRVETPEPTPDNRPIVVATPQPPLPEGVTEVKYFPSSWNENETKVIRSLAEQYNQRNPEKRIKVVMEFYGGQDEDYMAQMASEFDCFTWGAPWWEGTSSASMLSINALLSAEPASFTNDFDPQQLDVFRHEGELYALPASRQMSVMAYNADLLAKRGLPTPSLDWTFDDFLEMVEEVASTDSADTSYGFTISAWDDFFLAGKGVKWADLTTDPPAAYFDSAEMSSYLNWLSQAIRAGALLVQDETDWDKADRAMREGKVAFWLATMGEPLTWIFPPGEEAPYKMGVAPMPKMPTNSNQYAWANDRGHYISSSSKEPRACWDWFKFLSEQPNAFGGVPARRSVNTSTAWEASVGADVAAVYRAAVANYKPIDTSEQESYNPISWPFYSWRGELLSAGMRGEDTRSVATAVQIKADSYLDCMAGIDITKLNDQEIQEQVTTCVKQVDPTGQW